MTRLPKPKISGEHHIHFTAAEVFDSFTASEQEKALPALRLPSDITTSHMAGVLLWLAALPDALHKLVCDSDLLDAKNVSDYVKRCKLLSVQAKSLQNLVPDDLRTLFEADVLANRNVGVLDWEDERDHRRNPNLVDVSYDEVYRVAHSLFQGQRNGARPPRAMRWKDFWDARWQWSAAGSVHSQYAEDLNYVSQERELKNKFITLCAMPDYDINHFIRRPPELHAWSSVKYEWAKMRAIYGTDLTSYVLTHFAFSGCEEALPNHFPVGSKATPQFVSARVGAVLHGAIPFCLDYEDFNSQHSYDSMRAVMNAYLDAYASHLSPEQRAAGAWAVQSVENTIVTDNMGTNSTYACKGTLMSGWRLTTFVNSVLNYVYTRLLVGAVTTSLRSVHNGDDVLLGVRNFQAAQQILGVAQKRNVRLQRTKSAFGGIAEFLRVDHRRGQHGQYLARNIATLVHSRIESKMAVSLTDVVEAFEERGAEFVVRGGSAELLARLRHNYYDRVTTLFHSDKHVAYDIKVAHRVVGGISTRVDSSTKTFIRKNHVRSEVALPKKLPGVVSYARAVRKALDLQVDPQVVTERIYSATLNAVQLVRTSVSTEPTQDTQRYSVYKALYKAYASVTSNAYYGKAKLTGFVIDVLSKHPDMAALAKLVSSSRDPLTFMSVLA